MGLISKPTKEQPGGIPRAASEVGFRPRRAAESVCPGSAGMGGSGLRQPPRLPRCLRPAKFPGYVWPATRWSIGNG